MASKDYTKITKKAEAIRVVAYLTSKFKITPQNLVDAYVKEISKGRRK